MQRLDSYRDTGWIRENKWRSFFFFALPASSFSIGYEVRSSQGAPGHRKEHRCDEPGSDLPVRDTTREYVFEDRGNDETVTEAWPCTTRVTT